jgi:hypothetical protein
MPPPSTKRDAGPKHEGDARSSPYPMSRLAPSHDLVDVARRIAEADTMIGSVAAGKLRVIAEQIESLKEEARRILEETRKSLDLHRARISFSPRPGGIYHLYRRAESGELWFSMIAPSEWSGAPPHAFEGSYRLELDQSWTPIDADDPAASERAQSPDQLVQRLLGGGDGERER